MVIFTSQAPILVVVLPVLAFMVVVDGAARKPRRSILVLSAVALGCLIAALPLSTVSTSIAALLYAIGITLVFVLPLYTIATARRGKQGLWLAEVVIASGTALVAAIAVRVTLGSQNADSAAVATFAIACVPGISTLLYGLFAPDIPKPRGSM